MIVTFGSVFNIPSIAFGGVMPKSVIRICSSPWTVKPGVLAFGREVERDLALDAGDLQHADAAQRAR